QGCIGRWGDGERGTERAAYRDCAGGRGIGRVARFQPRTTDPPFRSCVVPLARSLSIFHSTEGTWITWPLIVWNSPFVKATTSGDFTSSCNTTVPEAGCVSNRLFGVLFTS